MALRTIGGIISSLMIRTRGRFIIGFMTIIAFHPERGKVQV